jgi:hypothetical protein
MCSYLARKPFAGWIILSMLQVVGCTNQKTPLSAPTASIEQTSYIGTAVSGPTQGKIDADAINGAIHVSVQLVAIKQASLEKLSPPAADARLIVATRDRQPVLPAGELTGRLRCATGDAAKAFASQLESAPPHEVVKWEQKTLAIPKGVVAKLTIADSSSFANPDDRRQIQLLFRNAPDRSGALACEAAVGIVDLVNAQKSEDTKESSAANPLTQPPSWQRELLVTRPIPVVDGITGAIVIPFEFKDANAHFFAAIIDATPAPQPADSDWTTALEQCKADVKKESDAAAARANAILASQLNSNWPGFEASLSAARDPKTRRQSMVYLASQSGARLSRDVYLVADDPTLEKLLAAIANRIGAVKPADQSDSNLAWILDFTTLQTLSKMLNDNQLAPELSSVLTSFGGEAGRHASSLDEITKNLTGPGELQTRLIAENMIYLEDSSPAARVRAFDWLTSRKTAPAGYDPLGPARARKDALENALQKPGQQS